MSTAARRRPGATRPARPAAPRTSGSRARDLTVTVLVAGGSWGLLVPREAPHDRHTVAAGLATVSLPDGTLRVDGLVDKQVGHVMAGMTAAEDVPEGMRRVGVNVSLGATGDRPLSYTRSAFTVSGPGVTAVAPSVGQLSDGTLAPGQSISGSLSFDVPKEATTLRLSFRGGAPVALPDLPPLETGEHAPDAGPAPAAPAPMAPHEDAPGAAPDHHDAPGAAPHH